MQSLGASIITAFGLFWKAFWALALGYGFSSFIQVFISKKAASKHLGKDSPKQLALASILGFFSSSCSFAALSSTRSLFVKGASLVSALAYMFASTNLAVEVAALAYVFLGWQYAVALFAGAPILIMIEFFLVRLTKPEKLTQQALEHAKKITGEKEPKEKGLPKSFSEKISNMSAWKKVGATYISEWKMVYKELTVGFLVAGLVATVVPRSFFQTIFPTEISIWLKLPIQSLMAPFLAILTVIGSMGNGPLAAVLANNGIVFGAIMAFLYSDFNVPPSLKINANYYGWPFALYIGFITAVSAVLTGIAVHIIFSFANVLPRGAKSIESLTRFQIDYTFFLNVFSLIIAGTLVYLGIKNSKKSL